MTFRVELDIFRGPMDLLLYLVRKHEVEVLDLPIAPIAEQFVQHLEVLEQLDVNSVGDFLEMASTLLEIKSRLVLPRNEEVEETIDDPRQELVQRLLEYKQFKDAASILEERSRRWQQRFPRLTDDLAEGLPGGEEEQFQEVELWDLVSAFGRILRESATSQPASIVYDDTPIHLHMQRIFDELRSKGRLSFTHLFQPGQHKSSLIGIFLAILELVRNHGVITDQNQLFGEIWIVPGRTETDPATIAPVETYEHGSSVANPNNANPTAEASAMPTDESTPAAKPPRKSQKRAK